MSGLCAIFYSQFIVEFLTAKKNPCLPPLPILSVSPTAILKACAGMDAARACNTIGGDVFNEELLAEVKALREEMRAERVRLSVVATSIPRREVYTKPEAAQLLGGISVKTLDRMIARMQISTVELGERDGVPRVEIERLATPKERPMVTKRALGGHGKRGRRRSAEKSAEQEAAELRAEIRKRR